MRYRIINSSKTQKEGTEMEISENSATLEILNSSGSVIITPAHNMHRSALYTLSTEWMHKRACARVGIFSVSACVCFHSVMRATIGQARAINTRCGNK